MAHGKRVRHAGASVLEKEGTQKRFLWGGRWAAKAGPGSGRRDAGPMVSQDWARSRLGLFPIALQQGVSGCWGGGDLPQSQLCGDPSVCFSLLQLLPLTPCLLAASLFAAPPRRLPHSASWGPS